MLDTWLLHESPNKSLCRRVSSKLCRESPSKVTFAAISSERSLHDSLTAVLLGWSITTGPECFILICLRIACMCKFCDTGVSETEKNSRSSSGKESGSHEEVATITNLRSLDACTLQPTHNLSNTALNHTLSSWLYMRSRSYMNHRLQLPDTVQLPLFSRMSTTLQNRRSPSIWSLPSHKLVPLVLKSLETGYTCWLSWNRLLTLDFGAFGFSVIAVGESKLYMYSPMHIYNVGRWEQSRSAFSNDIDARWPMWEFEVTHV